MAGKIIDREKYGGLDSEYSQFPFAEIFETLFKFRSLKVDVKIQHFGCFQRSSTSSMTK